MQYAADLLMPKTQIRFVPAARSLSLIEIPLDQQRRKTVWHV